MSRDLTNLYIDETFEFLLQKSGSELQNGLGVRQDLLDVSASYAVSSSQAENAKYLSIIADTADFDNPMVWANGTGTNTSVYSQVNANFRYNPVENTLKNVSLQGNADTATSASYALTASYAVSASHEIIKEVSSSYADYAKEAGYATSSLQAFTASYVAGNNVNGPVADAVNAVSSSYALTASYALNAGAGDGFPYTGSAGISGSLDVVGPITSQTFGTISLTGDSPGVNRNIIDSTGADFTVIRSDSGMVIDNTAGTGSISVFTNGNMQYEPQGDLDFYTPTGNINLTGNRGIFTAQDTFNLTSNTTQDFQGISLQAPNVRINLSRTGSGAGDFALSAPGFGTNTPGMLLGLGTGSYGDNPTVANMLFTGDDAFFSAVGNFYIKNVFNDTGSITVWSESELQLRGDESVRISGDTFANPNDPIPIDIVGSTFMDSFTSGIMAFQPQIGTYTRVTQYQRAFVETPLVVNNQGTIEIETGATLKVINEL